MSSATLTNLPRSGNAPWKLGSRYLRNAALAESPSNRASVHLERPSLTLASISLRTLALLAFLFSSRSWRLSSASAFWRAQSRTFCRISEETIFFAMASERS